MNSLEDLTQRVLSTPDNKHYFKNNSELMHYIPALICAGKVKPAYWYEDSHVSSCGTVRQYTMWLVCEIVDERAKLASWIPSDVYSWEQPDEYTDIPNASAMRLDEIIIDNGFIGVADWIRANVPAKSFKDRTQQQV